MKSPVLSDPTAADIEAQTRKVLRALGNPEPPLDLRIVRELLKLNREYYSSTDDGILNETIARLTMAGRQLLRRPSLLLDAVRKFSLQALYLPDQKRILLDQDAPKLKHRWNEAHEIGHSIIPWHAEFLHGDDMQTLTSHCHQALEAEANHAAGRLLFLGDRFAKEAADLTIGFGAVQELKDRYKNTIASTLWRYVEESNPDIPIFGLVSAHPHRTRRDGSFDPSNPCRHMMQSPAFAAKFKKVTDLALFQQLEGIVGSQSGGMIGQGEIVIADDNGSKHIFRVDVFFNSYDALTVGWQSAPHETIVAVR